MYFDYFMRVLNDGAKVSFGDETNETKYSGWL